MEKFLQIVENPVWHRQFLFGLILAVIFGGTTLLTGFHFFWAIPQITVIAVVKEHYVQHLEGEFNWRNFFFMLVPIMAFYILYTAF